MNWFQQKRLENSWLSNKSKHKNFENTYFHGLLFKKA
jgi:hypothetical protein